MEIRELARRSHDYGLRRGFWPRWWQFWRRERSKIEIIALLHSEASERLEVLRNREGPERLAEELADLFIRAADAAEGWGIDIEEAIRKKMAYNETRPDKHNKEF